MPDAPAKDLAAARAAARKKAEKLKEKKAAEAKAKEAAAATPAETTTDDAAPAAEAADSDTKAETSAEAAKSTEATTGEVAADASDADTRAEDLQRQLEATTSARDDLQLEVNALSQKVNTLETLKTELQEEVHALKAQLAESQQQQTTKPTPGSRPTAQGGGGTDDEHLDELEDEERQRLVARVRALEEENAELKRGIWHDRRRDMQVGMDDGTLATPGGGKFTDVDLSTPYGQQQARGQSYSHGQQGAGAGLGGLFASGISAITGAVGPALGGGGVDDGDGLLEDDDGGDMEFDEEAFRKAREDAARARIERVKEVKRGLDKWKGWRMDLFDGRRGGGGEGMGDVFEI